MGDDISSACTYTKAQPHGGAKQIIVETAATVDDTDTIVITMADYGISTFLGITGFRHDTTDSVVVTENPTTSVTTGTLTITVAGSTDNKKRVFIVWGI